MNITTAGADLAKSLITVCAQDSLGKTVERRDLRREAFLAWLRRLPAGCVVGMEACSASHYWAREIAALGLQPRIMAAEFVQPYRKSRAGKNDRNDAEAIAMTQPAQQPAPVMRAATGFQYDLGRLLFGEKALHLVPPEFTAKHWAILLIDPMEGEDVLGCVDRDALILHGDGPWLMNDNSTLAQDAVGPSTPTTRADLDSR